MLRAFQHVCSKKTSIAGQDETFNSVLFKICYKFFGEMIDVKLYSKGGVRLRTMQVRIGKLLCYH